MIMSHPIVGQGHTIKSVSMSYRYLAGFDSGPGAWPVLSLNVLSAASGKTLKTLYTSPPLDKFQFDRGDAYSPPIAVSADGLDIPNTEPVYLALSVVNNARNLQIPLDAATGLQMRVTWNPKDEGFTHGQFHSEMDGNINNQVNHLHLQEEL